MMSMASHFIIVFGWHQVCLSAAGTQVSKSSSRPSSSPTVVEDPESGFVLTGSAGKQKPTKDQQKYFPAPVKVDFANRGDGRMSPEDRHTQTPRPAPASHCSPEFDILSGEKCLIKTAKGAKCVWMFRSASGGVPLLHPRVPQLSQRP